MRKPRVPIVQLSLPVPRAPGLLFEAGKALTQLREQGASILGSGGIVHNLARLHFEDKDAAVEPWASAFDDWVAGCLGANDASVLLAYRTHAPHAALAVPTTEHFDPLFFVLGSLREDDRLKPIFEGFHYGSLSMRSFAYFS